MATEILMELTTSAWGRAALRYRRRGEGEGQSLVTSFQVDHPGGAGAENRGA